MVGVIAGLATTEIEGIAGMSAGPVEGITQILTGKKNLSKGVKVTVGENSATIDLYLVVEYGINIPQVALKVQENVKSSRIYDRFKCIRNKYSCSKCNYSKITTKFYRRR